MAEATRRRFLELVGGAAAVGVAGCSSSSGPVGVGDVSAGPVSALLVGTLKPVGTQPVCIARDAGGVYARTLTCTHQGCNIADGGTVTESLIECPCHGSQFDANGDVVRGPAASPLVHYAVSADATGELTIHGDTEVSESTRLAV
jgi:cytochrome b6-f complex iron-sulfur subunit